MRNLNQIKLNCWRKRKKSSGGPFDRKSRPLHLFGSFALILSFHHSFESVSKCGKWSALFVDTKEASKSRNSNQWQQQQPQQAVVAQQRRLNYTVPHSMLCVVLVVCETRWSLPVVAASHMTQAIDGYTCDCHCHCHRIVGMWCNTCINDTN
jgi:hypothetical protein